jgi:hypothetical protein
LFGKHVAEAVGVYSHRHDHVHDAEGEAVPIETDPADASGASVARPRRDDVHQELD